MDQRPRNRLATVLFGRPEKLRSSLEDTLSALVGEKVACEPYTAGDSALADAFGDATFFVAPLGEGGFDDTAGLMALDRRAAIRCGGALAMLSAAELSSLSDETELPEKVAGSLNEVCALLVGALSKMSRPAGLEGHPELVSGGEVVSRAVGSWPEIVSVLGEDPEPLVAAFGLAIGEKAAGVLLVATSGDAEAGTGGGTRPETLDGAPVRFLGRPGDPAQVSLGELLEALGARVLPMHSSEPSPETPVAAFVVSRSPADLRVRMESLGADGGRPTLVIACSDRPTRDLVLTARQAGADDFLVLPTSRDRVLFLMARALQPA